MRRSWTFLHRLPCLAFLLLSFIGESVSAQTPLPAEITHDIVYVRAHRYGDDVITKMPEIKDPICVEAGTDLMLLHPNGTEEILVDGGNGAVLDPNMSFDGEWVLYAKIQDVTNSNSQRRGAPRSGSDLYQINLPTRKIAQITFQE